MSYDAKMSRRNEQREIRRVLGAELRGPILDMADMQFSLTHKECEPLQNKEPPKSLTMGGPLASDLP